MLLNILCVVIWHATNINWSTSVCSYFIPSKYQENERRIKTATAAAAATQQKRAWKWNHSKPKSAHRMKNSHTCMYRMFVVHENHKHKRYKRSRVHCQNWILKRLTSLIRIRTTFFSVALWRTILQPLLLLILFSFLFLLLPLSLADVLCLIPIAIANALRWVRPCVYFLHQISNVFLHWPRLRSCIIFSNAERKWWSLFVQLFSVRYSIFSLSFYV